MAKKIEIKILQSEDNGLFSILCFGHVNRDDFIDAVLGCKKAMEALYFLEVEHCLSTHIKGMQHTHINIIKIEPYNNAGQKLEFTTYDWCDEDDEDAKAVTAIAFEPN